MKSSNFRQRIPNEGDNHRHQWQDPRFIPTTNHHHRHKARQHPGDRHSSYFVSYVPRARNKPHLGGFTR